MVSSGKAGVQPVCGGQVRRGKWPILSSIAQGESEDFSDNNRWFIEKRFRDGTYKNDRTVQVENRKETCRQGYRRVTWARNGKKKIVWRCSNRLKHGKRNCQKSESIEEKVLHSAIMKAIDQATEDAEELIRAGRDNILYLTGNYSRENEEKIKEDNDDWKKGFENYYRKIFSVVTQLIILHQTMIVNMA